MGRWQPARRWPTRRPGLPKTLIEDDVKYWVAVEALSFGYQNSNIWYTKTVPVKIMTTKFTFRNSNPQKAARDAILRLPPRLPEHIPRLSSALAEVPHAALIRYPVPVGASRFSNLLALSHTFYMILVVISADVQSPSVTNVHADVHQSKCLCVYVHVHTLLFLCTNKQTHKQMYIYMSCTQVTDIHACIHMCIYINHIHVYTRFLDEL